jgi:hypothetical protein
VQIKRELDWKQVSLAQAATCVATALAKRGTKMESNKRKVTNGKNKQKNKLQNKKGDKRLWQNMYAIFADMSMMRRQASLPAASRQERSSRIFPTITFAPFAARTRIPSLLQTDQK